MNEQEDRYLREYDRARDELEEWLQDRDEARRERLSRFAETERKHLGEGAETSDGGEGAGDVRV